MSTHMKSEPSHCIECANRRIAVADVALLSGGMVYGFGQAQGNPATKSWEVAQVIIEHKGRDSVWRVN